MITCKFRSINWCIGLMFLLVVIAAPQIGQAVIVPLIFDTYTPATNVTNMNGFGPGYTGSLTMDFTDVADSGTSGLDIDMRVTAVVQSNTGFGPSYTTGSRGYIPNYYTGNGTTEPNNDLGFLYDGLGVDNTSGVTFTLNFFDGTSGFSTPYTIQDFELLIYDVDGSNADDDGGYTQDEWFNAYYIDGLYSYATGNLPQSVTATPTATGVNFFGPGKNFDEADSSGAVILRYLNTDSVTLAFGAKQYTHSPDPVFSAIDGNLSLIDRDDFDPPTVVPIPSALWLLGSGLIGIVGIRRKLRT